MVTPLAAAAVEARHHRPMPDRTTSSLPTATVRETLGVLAGVVGPAVAKGPIIRRRSMVALAERMALDRRAVRRMQRLRDRYGSGPVMLRVLGQPRAVVLSPDHVRRVLLQTPQPFATDSSEKRAALTHFEPRGVLISRGAERADRRRYNESVLDSHRALHRLSSRFVTVVDEELGGLGGSPRPQSLTWERFSAAWFRLIRRVVLGSGARDDQELTDQIARLRRHANWAMLRPVDRGLRNRFFTRLAGHISRAEAGSLAEVMATTPQTTLTEPIQQVPQWLFAFDSAGIATYRALALLAAHPEYAERARVESSAADPSSTPLPLLRAALLESVRLWPTTPMLLRQTTAETNWDGRAMPAGTGVLIFAPFFHRDGSRLSFADRFAPELWLKEEPAEPWSLVPFSAGPASCPGRNLVLLLASATLALLLRRKPLGFASARGIDSGRPLPGTLNHFALRFQLGR
jgi:cytochrome P450